MKKKAIATGGSKNQFPAIAVLVLRIAQLNPNMADEIVIFHDGVSVKEQRLLNSIFPCRFILYRFPVDADSRFERTVWHHFTFMLFCKYECFKLLDEYESILWTDYDVFLLDDISELFVKQKNDFACMTGNLAINKFNNNIYNHLEEIRDIDLINGISIRCGIFVVHDSFPEYKEFYSECIRLTNEFSDCLSCAEEGIISLLLQRHEIPVDDIDPKIYCVHPKFYNNEVYVKILHASGNPKFWNGLNYKPWNLLMRKWVEMGGGKMKNNGYMLKKLIRDILPYGVVNYLLNKR